MVLVMPMVPAMVVMVWMGSWWCPRYFLNRLRATVVVVRGLVAVAIDRLGFDRRHLLVFVLVLAARRWFLIFLVDDRYYGFRFVLFFPLSFQLYKSKFIIINKKIETN